MRMGYPFFNLEGLQDDPYNNSNLTYILIAFLE